MCETVVKDGVKACIYWGLDENSCDYVFFTRSGAFRIKGFAIGYIV